MDVVVFGAGSLGSLIGGLLAREHEHEVTLVGRDSHAAVITRDGLRVTGAYDLRVWPAAQTHVDGGSWDVAVVTVKAYATAAAAEALAGCTLGGVVSLQNGMGNEDILAGLGVPVVAGTATYGAVLQEPGVVECTGEGVVTLGAYDAPMELVERVGAAFRAAGITTAVTRDVRGHLWEKLAVNTGINPVTALARVPNGAVLEDPLAGVAVGAAVETAGVARDHGVGLSDEDAVAALERVARGTRVNTSSMRQDVEAGRRTEIDAINGYVVEQAQETGSVSVPVNDALTRLIRGWEAGVGHRDTP